MATMPRADDDGHKADLSTDEKCIWWSQERARVWVVNKKAVHDAAWFTHSSTSRMRRVDLWCRRRRRRQESPQFKKAFFIDRSVSMCWEVEVLIFFSLHRRRLMLIISGFLLAPICEQPTCPFQGLAQPIHVGLPSLIRRQLLPAECFMGHIE